MQVKKVKGAAQITLQILGQVTSPPLFSLTSKALSHWSTGIGSATTCFGKGNWDCQTELGCKKKQLKWQHRTELKETFVSSCSMMNMKSFYFLKLLDCLEYFPFASVCPEVTFAFYLLLQNYLLLAQLWVLREAALLLSRPFHHFFFSLFRQPIEGTEKCRQIENCSTSEDMSWWMI